MSNAVLLRVTHLFGQREIDPFGHFAIGGVCLGFPAFGRSDFDMGGPLFQHFFIGRGKEVIAFPRDVRLGLRREEIGAHLQAGPGLDVFDCLARGAGQVFVA